MELIKRYERASGQQINCSKTAIFLVEIQGELSEILYTPQWGFLLRIAMTHTWDYPL
jgi:hypothetical protein